MAGRIAAAAVWDGPDLLLRLRVQPGARRNEILGALGDCVKVRVVAAPVDGRANTQLIGYLAECFGVNRSCVTLVHGQGSRIKLARIQAPARVPLEVGQVTRK
ncbi:MAG: DUF167 family protein [Gammaproteobacteria bacterium]|nr:DUF167 family protein [Gammaproteobacteria bacterium]